jgi:hypothetical protein
VEVVVHPFRALEVVEVRQTYQASVEVVGHPYQASGEVVVQQKRQTCQALVGVVGHPYRASVVEQERLRTFRGREEAVWALDLFQDRESFQVR